MNSVAENYRYVVGVDTHAQHHVYAIVNASTGAVDETQRFPTTAQGVSRALEWVARRTGGDLDAVLVSAEGTGSYGARLTKHALQIGYRVVDAPSPKRDRGGDKNDTIDAIAAARNVLGRPADRLADARTGEAQQALKVLLGARNRMATESTRAKNALIALLREFDLGTDARRTLTLTQLRQISRWRERNESTATAIAREEAVTLATRWLELRASIRANGRHLNDLVLAQAPVLLDQPGVGPVNAAIVLSVWSHPGRIHTGAALARIGGAAPIQIASGNRSEHRLSRGGDRQLNRALHSIANTRMRSHQQTREYVARRQAENISTRRIRRVLKTYIARQLHRTLTNHYATPIDHPVEVPMAA